MEHFLSISETFRNRNQGEILGLEMKFYQVDESVRHGASVTGAGECSDGESATHWGKEREWAEWEKQPVFKDNSVEENSGRPGKKKLIHEDLKNQTERGKGFKLNSENHHFSRNSRIYIILNLKARWKPVWIW